MSTNYYAETLVECSNCDHTHLCKNGTHLGKNSVGWKFLFAYNDGLYYEDIEGLKRWIADKNIFDEYNKPVTHEEFWNVVEKKQESRDHIDNPHIINISNYQFMEGDFS